MLRKLMCTIAACTLMSTCIYAADNIIDLEGCIVVEIGNSVAYVNNEFVPIDGSNIGVVPIIINNKTMLPIRFIAENCGAKVGWNNEERVATIETQSKIIKLTPDSNIMDINGETYEALAPVTNIKDRLYVPTRAVAEFLGKIVSWDNRKFVIVSDQNMDYTNAITSLIAKYNDTPITYEEKIVLGKNIKLVTVDLNSPTIELEVSIPNNTLNTTKSLQEQVLEKDSFCAVDANFFESYTDIKDPIGNVMVDSKIIFGASGSTTVGITANNKVVFAEPYTFVKGGVNGKYENKRDGCNWEYNSWYAYEINTLTQSANNVILYTPERGSTVDIKVAGQIVVIEKDEVVDSYYLGEVTADNPQTVKIPINGYVIYNGCETLNDSTNLKALQIGNTVQYEYLIKSVDNPNFDWKDYKYALTGGPNLVSNGLVEGVSTNVAFAGDRFTSMSAARMALGATQDNKLLLVTGSSLTIAELKQVMFELGSYNAVNLDGGGSTGMYYDGEMKVIPGRELSTTLHVFYKQ